MSKVVVVVRTLNERKHIDRFCRGYSWADKILVADGGSTDTTLELARRYPNVLVEPFEARVYKNGVWRNPEGKHINFLVQWAEEINADWTIMDDCDSTPNFTLQREAREVIEQCHRDTLFAYRMYLYGTDTWFPELTGGSVPPSTRTAKGKRVTWHSLWGWRTDKRFRWQEDDPWMMAPIEPNPTVAGRTSRCRFDYPNCLLHYFCLDEEEIQRKLNLYQLGMEVPQMLHPLQAHGKLESLPTWARP